MRKNLFISLLCSFLLAPAACKRANTTQESAASPAGSPGVANHKSDRAKFDACGLIKKEEIESIIGSPINESKSSERSHEAMRFSQCFYTAMDFSKSVSLAVTQSDPDSPAKRSAKDLWKEIFGRYNGEEKEGQAADQTGERLRGEEEEKKSPPPEKISGIGDEAYWTGRVSGTLYVLKKDAFIRISVGGPDNEEIKLNKSKALAEKALPRL